MPTAPATVPFPAPSPSQAPRRALDATSACVQFAQRAATVDTTTGDLGRSRPVATRTFGTPQLQAAFSGSCEGRNSEQETWRRQHQGRVSATAVPVAHNDQDDHDELAQPGTDQPRPGKPVAVTVTGTARWTAATAPNRLDCLTVQAVAGWLVDDVAVTVLQPADVAG